MQIESATELQSKAAAESAEDDSADFQPIRAGSLEVTLASTPDQIERAQRLRYNVFFKEMGGHPTVDAARLERDFDDFDACCDHLLVLEHNVTHGEPSVVGTYRLLRGRAMQKIGRFYSESEFDITNIRARKTEVLELGRSCVDREYRNRAVVQLLWRGIGQYVALHEIQFLFGCGSLLGADPKLHDIALSYLYHYHLAPPDVCVRALPQRYVEMNVLPKASFDPKEAFNNLPALVKGYLRAGSYVGDGAVVDEQCNTTDIAILLQLDRIKDKYVQRYTGGKDTAS